MAQSTILTTGNSGPTLSSDIVLATGVRATVGIFGFSGQLLNSEVVFTVYMDTPSDDLVYAKLSCSQPQIQLIGPGTFRVSRPPYTGPAFGVFLET